jgi:hypothetical protein
MSNKDIQIVNHTGMPRRIAGVRLPDAEYIGTRTSVKGGFQLEDGVVKAFVVSTTNVDDLPPATDGVIRLVDQDAFEHLVLAGRTADVARVKLVGKGEDIAELLLGDGTTLTTERGENRHVAA